MKSPCKNIIVLAFASLIFAGMLQAEQRGRNEAVRGIFVRLTEQKIGDQEYLGIVVKPFDRDDHLTFLVARNRAELIQTARKLDAGARLGISFVSEGGHKFIKGMEAEMRREIRDQGPEGEKQVILRRQVVRESSEGQRPESRRSRSTRRDLEPERPRGREERQDRGPAAQLDQLQRQLRQVVSGHLDRMSKSVREVMADHLWRMDAEFRELRVRVDRIERQLDQLRAENERLRRELRERTRPRKEREEQVRERKENREREQREEPRNNTP